MRAGPPAGIVAGMHRLLLLALALAGMALAGAASAQAASLTFIKDHDVWISNPDGSGAVRVTRDGTAKEPYRSPTRNAAGTIAALKGFHVHLLRADGRRIRRFLPGALRDGMGAQTTAGTASLDFSPDGTKLAYAKVSLNCANVDCMARGVSGVMNLRGRILATQKEYTGAFPSWVTDRIVLSHGGYGHQNMLWNTQTGAWENWFDDSDLVAPEHTTDLGDGEVSRDRRAYVAVRGYDATTAIATYHVNGDLAAPSPPPPTFLCTAQGQVSSPTISGDGATAWWEEPDGVWTFPVSADCPDGRLLIPGASEPDWSPADVRRGRAGRRG